MELSALAGLAPQTVGTTAAATTKKNNTDATGFDAILQQAVNMVSETNDYQNAAESAEIQFALGESTSTHELLVAQEKANVALQYTVAVRDKVLDAYREIMNMQM